MKIIIPLLIVLALIPAVSAQVVTVNDLDPTPAEAGEFVTVWFKIDNPSNDKFTDVTVTAKPKDGLSLSQGEDPTQFIGTLGGAQFDIVRYRFFVDPNAPDGLNEIEVTVERNGGGVSFDLPIEVEEKDFEDVQLEVGDIDSAPTQIKPGDDNVKVEVTFQNLGDAKAQAVAAVIKSLPEGVTFVNAFDDTELIGSIDADSQGTADFFIDVAESVAPGTYAVPIELRYKYEPDPDDDDFIVETVMVDALLRVKETPLFEVTDVRFEPEQTLVGSTDNLVFITLKNVGADEAEFVRAKAFPKTEQPFIFAISADFAAARLLPDEEATIVFDYDVKSDAIQKEYNIDLEITNIVDDDVDSVTRSFQIDVSGTSKSRPTAAIGVIFIVLVVAAFFVWRRRGKGNGSKRVLVRR